MRHHCEFFCRGIILFLIFIQSHSVGRNAILQHSGYVIGEPPLIVEIDGVAGRISIADIGILYPYNYIKMAYSVNENIIYVLLRNSDFVSHRLAAFDIDTFQLISDIAINSLTDEFLHDIAVLNGNVYVSSKKGGVVKIKKIESDGSLTDVFTHSPAQGESSYSRLLISADSDFFVFSLLNTTGLRKGYHYYIINPDDWSVINQIIEPGVSPFNIIMRTNQQIIVDTSYGSFLNQTILSLPGLTFVENIQYPYTYGSSNNTIQNSITKLSSEEFDFSYDSSSPAICNIQEANYSGTIIQKKLFRSGQIAWQSDLCISNYVLPDNTSVDNVSLTDSDWIQSGGSPVEITAQLIPQGEMALRNILHTQFNLDVDNAQKGLYNLAAPSNLQGRYISDGVEQNRPIKINNPFSYSFAVDPVSSNIVGNGAFDLNNYGWNNASLSSDGSSDQHVLWLTAHYYFAAKDVYQILELPLTKKMMLSFDYRLNDSIDDAANLVITLEGLPIAQLDNIQSSDTYQNFSAVVSNPNFAGLKNAKLSFVLTSSGDTWFYVDNVSLINIGVSADLDNNGAVDLFDLNLIANQWLLEELSYDVATNGHDGIVNFLDWAHFAKSWQGDFNNVKNFSSQWLDNGAYNADIAPQPSGDGIVNFLDFALFAEKWLN